ncbi:MAG TPA: NAD(P)-dependent oxidoreductase [Candidatus Binataceae bacterium]|jgi:3-hydroxyisobutyrate dehydrogenase-like beta-hydroxyacid dehydrogenase|nr:NAD(P)-dependent oxidoreductase [Candidatus Binataceae bacterium]
MNLEAGFIGLGSMGLPMAQNLLAAGGVKLKVFNRTAAKAQPLTAKGATLAPSHADAATPGGIVLTMLADDAAVESMVMGEGGIAARLAPGGIHVSMSTIAPSTARRMAQYHAERGSIYVASPVFGRPDAAAARQLVICTSGPAAAKERVRPLQEITGRAIYDYGEEPGAANVVKVAGNFLIAAALEAMAEAFTIAERNGIDRVKVADMLGKTLFACPVYQGYGDMIAAKRHTPAGFKLSLGLKDLELALKTATEARVPVPVAALVHERMVAGLAHGREAMDWSALALGVLDDAAIK